MLNHLLVETGELLFLENGQSLILSEFTDTGDIKMFFAVKRGNLKFSSKRGKLIMKVQDGNSI